MLSSEVDLETGRSLNPYILCIFFCSIAFIDSIQTDCRLYAENIQNLRWIRLELDIFSNDFFVMSSLKKMYEEGKLRSHFTELQMMRIRLLNLSLNQIGKSIFSSKAN